MNVELKITGRVESLHLEPGDRVIVTLDSDRKVTGDQVASISTALKQAFPDHEAVILAGGLRIAKETA